MCRTRKVQVCLVRLQLVQWHHDTGNQTMTSFLASYPLGTGATFNYPVVQR